MKNITLGEFGRRKLSAICEGLAWTSQQTTTALALFDLMTSSWNKWLLNEMPYWRTDLSDDNSPFEFSLEFHDKEIKLRMLTESQSLPVTPLSGWESGLKLHERLAEQPGVDLSKFEKIRDLFTPKDKANRFALWNSVVLSENGKTLFKVYLNPQIHGAEQAPSLVKEALQRLNLHRAWEFIEARLHTIGDRAKFVFFSLDLMADEMARVKIYLANTQMSLQELDAQLEGSRNYIKGADIHWIQSLTRLQNILDSRHIVNYFAFTSENEEAPISNIQVPIRWYVENDTEALNRTLSLLHPQHHAKLTNAVRLMAERSLDVDRGLIAHVGVKQDKKGLCVVSYLSAEAYSQFTNTQATGS